MSTTSSTPQFPEHHCLLEAHCLLETKVPKHHCLLGSSLESTTVSWSTSVSWRTLSPGHHCTEHHYLLNRPSPKHHCLPEQQNHLSTVVYWRIILSLTPLSPDCHCLLDSTISGAPMSPETTMFPEHKSLQKHHHLGYHSLLNTTVSCAPSWTLLTMEQILSKTPPSPGAQLLSRHHILSITDVS